jgi:RNA polymerase sigma-70 factor (ECF subfamily)
MRSKSDIELVWNEFGSGLKSFILSKVKNEADASDILQDTYLKIHDNIDTLKDTTRIKAWIYQITRNLIIDYFRANYQKRPVPSDFSDLPARSASDRLMDIAIRDMIGMMDELSPEYCEALCFTEIEGMSQKEYAEKRGLSYSGAKSRVQRARVMLKDLLLQCCHYQFDIYGTVIEIQPKCCCCNPMEKHK